MSYSAFAVRTPLFSLSRTRCAKAIATWNAFSPIFNKAQTSTVAKHNIVHSTGHSLYHDSSTQFSGQQKLRLRPQSASGPSSAIANAYEATNLNGNKSQKRQILPNTAKALQHDNNVMPRLHSNKQRLNNLQAGRVGRGLSGGVVIRTPDPLGNGMLEQSLSARRGGAQKHTAGAKRHSTPGYSSKFGKLPHSLKDSVQALRYAQLGREPWQVQKTALTKKFGDAGWLPRKRLSPDSLEGIRALHAQYPEKYTTPVLANQFKVSPEAIRRILKSKWMPNDAEEYRRRERWNKRGVNIWGRMNALGIKIPRKWRDQGVGKCESHESIEVERSGLSRSDARVKSGHQSEGIPNSPAVNPEIGHPISMADKIL